jgi:gas vesicle protein
LIEEEIMSKDTGAAGTIITAFMLGTITGAAVALLVAPATGDEMRRVLGEKARESKDKASDAARQAREFADRQRGIVATAIERGREAYQQAKSTGTTPAGTGQEPL